MEGTSGKDPADAAAIVGASSVGYSRQVDGDDQKTSVITPPYLSIILMASDHGFGAGFDYSVVKYQILELPTAARTRNGVQGAFRFSITYALENYGKNDLGYSDLTADVEYREWTVADLSLGDGKLDAGTTSEHTLIVEIGQQNERADKSEILASIAADAAQLKKLDFRMSMLLHDGYLKMHTWKTKMNFNAEGSCDMYVNLDNLRQNLLENGAGSFAAVEASQEDCKISSASGQLVATVVIVFLLLIFAIVQICGIPLYRLTHCSHAKNTE